MTAVPAHQPVRVYWIPGCANCVRLKGHLSARGVPYDAVNVQAGTLAPAEAAGLARVGIPAVGVGADFVTGLDLAAVEAALGLAGPDDGAPLAVAELITRAGRLMGAAADLGAQLPPEHGADPLPGTEQTVAAAIRFRDGTPYIPHRTPVELVAHIAGHARKFADFLIAMDEPVDLSFATTQAEFSAHGEPPPGCDITAAAAAIRAQQARVRDLSDATAPARPDRPIDTYFGTSSAHELAQLMTCSLAQHTRQLVALVAGYGLVPDAGLDADDFTRLGLPAEIWG